MLSLRRRSNSAFFSCAACASDTIYHSHSAPVYPILKIQSIKLRHWWKYQSTKNTSQVCKPNLIQCNIYYYQTTHFFLNFTRYSCQPNFDSSLPNNPGLIFHFSKTSSCHLPFVQPRMARGLMRAWLGPQEVMTFLVGSIDINNSYSLLLRSIIRAPDGLRTYRLSWLW